MTSFNLLEVAVTEIETGGNRMDNDIKRMHINPFEEWTGEKEKVGGTRQGQKAGTICVSPNHVGHRLSNIYCLNFEISIKIIV